MAKEVVQINCESSNEKPLRPEINDSLWPKMPATFVYQIQHHVYFYVFEILLISPFTNEYSFGILLEKIKGDVYFLILGGNAIRLL